MPLDPELPDGSPLILNHGDQVRVLEPAGLDPQSIADLVVRSAAFGPTTVAEVLRRNEARGLVVLHAGRVTHEWYGPGAGPASLNLCYSVTKSFTGTLAATAMNDGRLDRRARVADLLPELSSSGFAEATVGDVADMTVALAYDEDYDDTADADTADGPADDRPAGDRPAGDRPAHGFGDYLVAIGLGAPGDATPPQPTSIRTLLAALGRSAGAHGETFAYATPVTDVLAWLLERADGRPYAEQLRDDLWSHVGAEYDASLAVDPAGTPLAGGGLSVTTRDLARFGQLVSDQATVRAGDVIAPEVIDTIRAGGDREAFARGGDYAYLGDYSYRDQWWLPGGTSRPLSAWGIFGQLLWIDVDAQVVVACHCGGALPSDQRRDIEQDAMCRALVEASSTWI